jgi:hypothetical protein
MNARIDAEMTYSSMCLPGAHYRMVPGSGNSVPHQTREERHI